MPRPADSSVVAPAPRLYWPGRFSVTADRAAGGAVVGQPRDYGILTLALAIALVVVVALIVARLFRLL